MSRLLISIASPAEALVALAHGADIIDGKDAAAGPLAALPAETLAAIVAAVDRRRPVSATVGDWPADPTVLHAAASRTAASGVDWIKVGFYPGGDWQACLDALAPFARQVPLIGLLFADHTPEPERHVAAFAQAGWRGMMLDTADKRSGSLRRHLDDASIGAFVRESSTLGLMSGIAGSLTLDDIPALLPLRPDVIGFRGAACEHGARGGRLDPDRLGALRETFDLLLAESAG